MFLQDSDRFHCINLHWHCILLHCYQWR